MILRAVLDRPVSVVIATLALVVIGLFSLLRLPVSLLPTLERPRLQVTVRDDERSREELLRLVVEPLERRFLSLSGVLEVAATVDDGRCLLVLDTEWQTDVDRLRIDAERRLGEVAGLGLDEVEIAVEAGDRRPILEIAVAGGGSAHARTVFAEEVLMPELGRLRGAGRLRRLGGALARAVVRPHGAALAARGLTAADLVDRLAKVGQSRPAGRLRDGGRVREMFVREPVGSLAELSALRLGARGASPQPGGATLGDLAAVALEEQPDPSSFRWNGEDAVLVELHRAPGANAVLLARDARRAVRELSRRVGRVGALGRGAAALRVEIVRDASLEVIDALSQLALAGFLGLLLGTSVMRWMLGSWRPTLALMVVVPASLVAAFGGFYLWGVSLDLVSLAGLALAAGMLVDNSIVVLEAIERARSEERGDAALEGTRQIALALAASFLTTAVVFVPLIYLRGLARAFFGVQAFAIVTALAVSLALSLTLTPVLARRLGARPVAGGGRSPGLRLYLALLERALGRPRRVIAAAAAVVAAGAALVPALPRELVPRGPSRVLAVDYRLPPALEPRETARRARQVEARLTAVAPAPVSVASLYRGRDERRAAFADEVERGSLELVFADAAAVAAARGALARELGRQPGVAGEVRMRRGAVAAALERSRSRVEVEASAATPRRAARLAERAAAVLRRRAGAAARFVRQDGSDTARPRPALVLGWNAHRITRLGAETEPLARQVRTGLGGFFAGRVEIPGVEPEVLVEATLPADPRLLPVRPAAANGGGGVVPLAAVATVDRRLEEFALERRNARPAVRLEIDGAAAAGRIAAALETMPLAVDEEVRLVGRAHEMRRSFAQLGWALGLALVLVFLAVAALYESLAMPLVVMTTVPVAAAGALGALAAAGQSLNVMSLLGLVLLAGIVVNNAIVLMHRIEQRRAAGLAAAAAIRAAAEERYRPILMTTVTTLLGLLPLAALGGEGTELRRALALAVAGGLVTSLAAALFVVPVLHQALVARAGTTANGSETDDLSVSPSVSPGCADLLRAMGFQDDQFEDNR